MPALDESNIMTLEKKPTMPLSFQRSAKEYLCNLPGRAEKEATRRAAVLVNQAKQSSTDS